MNLKPRTGERDLLRPGRAQEAQWNDFGDFPEAGQGLDRADKQDSAVGGAEFV